MITSIETNKIQLHEEIILGMHEMYIAKNHDYGNSFEKVRSEYPNAIAIRLSDKLNRLKKLLEADAQVVGENIDDTLIDLANYAVMELVERRLDAQYLAQYVANYRKPTIACADVPVEC